MNHLLDDRNSWIDQNSSTERRLIAELSRAEGLYRRALATIHACLPGDDGSADDIQLCLQKLEPLMKQTQAVEADLAPLRRQWLSASRKPGPELSQCLKVHEQLLSELICRINRLEQRMQEHRRAAIPDLDAHVRYQQMQRAYRQPIR